MDAFSALYMNKTKNDQTMVQEGSQYRGCTTVSMHVDIGAPMMTPTLKYVVNQFNSSPSEVQLADRSNTKNMVPYLGANLLSCG